MRVTRQTQRAHRAAILEQAGRMFRRDGLSGVNVAEITAAAGLTHGAFYGHFPSKDALAAESCRESLVAAAQKWRDRADRARARGDDPLTTLIGQYLTERHRDAPEEGCALPSLGGELVRNKPELRAALDAGVTALAEVLEDEIALATPGRDRADCARAALAMLAAMCGGLLLARALANDPDRSQAALRSAAELARRAAG
jgi:TetR/AcrR family transcriptional repressor of nem operon